MSRRDLSHHKITGYFEQILGVNRGKKIPLYDFDFTIGRSKNCYIISPDPNVSRTHCQLKYSPPTGWTIKDLISVNGTYIDDCRAPIDAYVPLTEGCCVYIGPSEDAPEGYRFTSVKNCEESSSEYEPPRRSTRCKTPSPQKQTINKAEKRKVSSQTHSSSSSIRDIAGMLQFPSSSNYNNVTSNSAEEKYFSDSSISSLDSLRTRIRKTESAEKRKQKKAKFCDKEQNEAVPSTSSDKQHSESPASFDRMSFLGVNTDDENSQSLLKKDEFSDWDEDCNSIKRFDLQRILNAENASKDCSDHIELDSKSVTVHLNLLKVLQKKVDDLQRALKTLNLKFSETMDENAKLSEILKSKEKTEMDIKDNLKKLLEDELICNICTEIFIKPVTLGCSHTFCQHCIFQWKKKKKQCPMCREKIETETTVLYMDSFIFKAIEQLDPAGIEKRNELIKNREELQKKKPNRKKSKSNRRRSVPTIPDAARNEDEVELLRSRISDIQSYTDDIQAYVDVIDNIINEHEHYEDDQPAPFYGGYGRCYNCGRAGHWANGCPY